jgi:hypothetical protein
METKELRIGNRVTDSFKYIQIVEYITQTGIRAYFPELHDVGVTETKDLKGIELTKEWLSKCDFKHQNELYYWLPLTNLKAELHCEIYENENVFIIASDFANLILNPIKYVHQLQNLYFALTNTELTIK